ncbi:hypothetical protein F2P81_000032 [Scophthalmus maximus]|uniref:Uncharacterized protein n=1 Tax=Scophthalmus maximus TaxID=52904 RepID=A0A6A4TNK4_SCOMX|nr:hypothetical protein F2P81_000032 [Scophthalmus maximus]
MFGEKKTNRLDWSVSCGKIIGSLTPASLWRTPRIKPILSRYVYPAATAAGGVPTRSLNVSVAKFGRNDAFQLDSHETEEIRAFMKSSTFVTEVNIQTFVFSIQNADEFPHNTSNYWGVCGAQMKIQPELIFVFDFHSQQTSRRK